MNGPDHYHEAEKILEEVKADPTDRKGNNAWRMGMAQAHATLALAAATALNFDSRRPDGDQIRVIGPSVLVRVLSGIGAHVAPACQDPLRARRCPGVCYASFAGSAGRHSQRTALAGMPRQ
jgi:hypothetical protein